MTVRSAPLVIETLDIRFALGDSNAKSKSPWMVLLGRNPGGGVVALQEPRRFPIVAHRRLSADVERARLLGAGRASRGREAGIRIAERGERVAEVDINDSGNG